MELNIILAGVGGQGILTTAKAISIAAMRRGLDIKQAEVHGMSQRGGAVQSHLRIADHPIHSDVIPEGCAHMILAAEPMEAIRYIHYLNSSGIVVANSVPVVNMANYGSVEEVLERLSKYPRHILLDANRLAGFAGSGRSVNMVMIGAAAGFLDLPNEDIEAAIAEMFAAKGDKLVAINQKAFALGRNAATAYRDGLGRGATSATVRKWLGKRPSGDFEEPGRIDFTADSPLELECELSAAEAKAVDQILHRVVQEKRRQLLEHEVYRLVELMGAISPPKHAFVPKGMIIRPEWLAEFPGRRVAIKIVSPEIVHKSDAGAIVFVEKTVEAVTRAAEGLMARLGAGRTAVIKGVLIVEFVEQAASGFGKELFVGIRSTREFGPVIAAGLGGVDTEYLVSKLRPGIAVAKALALDTSAEQFFALFKQTVAYDTLAGRARGHERIVSDGELLRCFRAFIAIARRFCVDRGRTEPMIEELEVNPFAFRRETMVPLDGRGRLGTATTAAKPRPIEKLDALLTPTSIAVLGVSASRPNFGRIILNNIQNCGYPNDRLFVIRDQQEPIDGVPCVPSVAALPERIDLLILAVAARDVARLAGEVIDSGKVESVIIIPGGMGETQGSLDVPAELRKAIATARSRDGGGPVFLGGNCMGVRSRPGRYDTFFIPEAKLNPLRNAPVHRAALISQSGGFVITRLSNWESLNPAFAISIGNQTDVTASDLLRRVSARDDVDAIGVYIEGFNDLDGVDFAEAVRDASAAGKTVVFYKAGRTSAGRSATAGHTASIAGDYDVCRAVVESSGAIVAETFKEFEQVMELATRLHAKDVRGRRIGVISNAGFETVGMADAIGGPGYQVEMASLSESTTERIEKILVEHRFDALVNVTNPLDLTPMAGDAAYEKCVQAMLDDETVDAVVASVVPLTPEMRTGPDEIGDADSIARRLPAVFEHSPKPLVAVLDCGPPFDDLARALRKAGVPIFPSSDQAIRSLGRYVCHRTAVASSSPSRGHEDSTLSEPAGVGAASSRGGLEVARS